MVSGTRVVGTLICLLAAVAGCGGGGPALHPTTGTVNYRGQPVAGAVVSFRSEAAKTIATGMTDAQGRFELTTYQAGKGVMAGKHKATVTKMSAAPPSGAAMSMEEALKNPKPAAAAAPKNELPAKYGDAVTPLLEYEVVAGKTNDFKIDLND